MVKKKRRFKCPECGSNNVIKWGIQCGHQRYKCKDCNNSYTPGRPDVSMSNRFVWFRKWISGKQRIEDIAEESGYSSRQLRRWFDEYLASAPEWSIRHRKSYHMLIDGTWFSGNHCLIVYRDADSKATVYYRFAENENEHEIVKDLEAFKIMRLNISSFTTDGSDDIIRAIKRIYPYTTRQRCVVHIERECLSWLTQHPKTSAGIKLRRLVCQISNIKTNNDKLFWIKELYKWHDDYEEFIKQKTVNKETGELTYTHDSVRRAYIHISRSISNMFKYIDDPEVPNNTNSLESFFGHLKDNLRIHRGLSQERLNNFIRWYLYFADEKKKQWRK